jgi:hypothetical protein
MNIRNRRGADISSDHHLVAADFQFKIMAVRKNLKLEGEDSILKNYKKK